jgi:hypothetical protein
LQRRFLTFLKGINMIKTIQAFVFGLILALGFSAVAGQSPNAANTAINPSGYYAPQNLDASGRVIVNTSGTRSAIGTAASGVVKATSGSIAYVSVTTAGSAVGAVYDSATVGGIGAANLLFVIPNTVGNYPVQFPANNGITVVPGTGQVISVSYQ